MLRLIFLFFFVTSPLISAPFPEDGSVPLRGVVQASVKSTYPKVRYDYPGVTSLERLREIALLEGFRIHHMEVLGQARGWFQDHLLFSETGALMKMASIHWDILDEYPPSSSTYFTMDDDDLYRPRWIDEVANLLKVKRHDLQVTRVEGGELITGLRKGESYAIVGESVIHRTRLHLKLAKMEDAVREFAEDIGVASDQVFVIPTRGHPVHLDTWMIALPNGRLLINRDDKFDLAAAFLSKKGFEVIRAWGTREVESAHGTMVELYNFFNGTVGKSVKDGKLFVMTNTSQNDVIDADWEAFLKEQGVSRVYFVGKWQPNAGIGCALAIF